MVYHNRPVSKKRPILWNRSFFYAHLCPYLRVLPRPLQPEAQLLHGIFTAVSVDNSRITVEKRSILWKSLVSYGNSTWDARTDFP